MNFGWFERVMVRFTRSRARLLIQSLARAETLSSWVFRKQ
jgi:hypothetical protein